MKCIYKITNKINGKVYIGQTINFTQRMRNHKSDAYNPNSKSYNKPLYCSIRKYGWDNFTKEIIEDYTDKFDWQDLNEREIFFIDYYKSLITQNGYNIETGGTQGERNKTPTYEEKLKMSKIFTPEQIKDIQQRMINGEKIGSIRKDYNNLTKSYAENINAGLNFKNEKWNYPLHDYGKDKSSFYTDIEISYIKQDIKNNITYKEISEKWDLSIGMISMINNGKQWYDKNITYPLCLKGCSRIHNQVWVKQVQQDLMNSKMTMVDISKKYNKCYSTIKKINSGKSHYNDAYIYPLTSNR